MVYAQQVAVVAVNSCSTLSVFGSVIRNGRSSIDIRVMQVNFEMVVEIREWKTAGGREIGIEPSERATETRIPDIFDIHVSVVQDA